MSKTNWESVIGQIDDAYLQEAAGTYGLAHAATPFATEKEISNMNTKRSFKKQIAVIAIAACLLLAIGVTAYATDLFGFRALLRPGTKAVDGQEYGVISLTQPQDVPAGTDKAVAEKLANSQAAWAEWRRWMANSPYEAEFQALQKEFEIDDAFDGYTETDNGDGTVTLEYFNHFETDGVWEQRSVGTKTVDAEAYAAYNELLLARARYDGGYDFNYGARCEGEVKMLEQIAAKYGLRLRRDAGQAFSSESTGLTGEMFHTNAQLAAMTAEIGCAGNIFYETPVGFDKMYWFDEGTFCVSYYVDLPSTGERVTCYGYNSMYATLSSGNEVINLVRDVDGFKSRTHTAPDGTELTILSNGESAYIYVYLETSFFAEHISGAGSLSDTDLDYIADYLNYSLIGK